MKNICAAAFFVVALTTADLGAAQRDEFARSDDSGGDDPQGESQHRRRFGHEPG